MKTGNIKHKPASAHHHGMKAFFMICLIVCCTIPVYQLQAQPTVVYHSANPKTDPGVTDADMIKLDYSYLFRIEKDLQGGIWGNGLPVNAQVKLSVYHYDNTKPDGIGQRLYYVYAEPAEVQRADNYYAHYESVYLTFVGASAENGYSMPVEFQSDDIKRLAQEDKNNNPAYCGNESVWTKLKNFLNFWGNDNEECLVYAPVQHVIVQIETNNKDAVDHVKIPGIVGGNLYIRNNTIVTAPVSPVMSFCDGHPGSPLCQLYQRVRNPAYNPQTVDIMLAVHRGYWGYNLGNSYPENTTQSVRAGFELMSNAKITEMDITVTKDGKLVMLHDYVMNRLTEYPGDKFSFDLSRTEIEQYNVRRRNGLISGEKVARFEDVLDYVNSADGILMLDIKEKQSKGKDPNCTANCDYQSKEAQMQSFREIATAAIRTAERKGMLQNLVIKTYLSFQEAMDLLGEDVFKIMWTPMLVSNKPEFRSVFTNPDGSTETAPDIDKMCTMVDDWNTRAPQMICSYETDFFVTEENNMQNPDITKRNKKDVMLNPFTRGGVHYTNILHYINVKTGRRSGIFSEDPVGPRGTVNRWAGWSIKDTRKDMRGDPFRLLAIPYGNIMLICTDRVDVWKNINQSFNAGN